MQDFPELLQWVFAVAEPNLENNLPENTDMAAATNAATYLSGAQCFSSCSSFRQRECPAPGAISSGVMQFVINYDLYLFNLINMFLNLTWRMPRKTDQNIDNMKWLYKVIYFLLTDLKRSSSSQLLSVLFETGPKS